MLITSRTIWAYTLTGVLLTIATTSSGQGLQHARANPQPPVPGGGGITSRPFAHPTRQVAVDSPAVASDVTQTQRAGDPFQPGSDRWKKMIRLIRQNAMLEAAVEKSEAIAEAELRAVEAIAETKLEAFEEMAKTKLEALEEMAETRIEAFEAIAQTELRAAEERQATLKEQNERLQARVQELEQELDQAEQEMRERSIHAAHMERQMLQQTELLDELQRQLQQTRDQPPAGEDVLPREDAPLRRGRGINRERAVPPEIDRLREQRDARSSSRD